MRVDESSIESPALAYVPSKGQTHPSRHEHTLIYFVLTSCVPLTPKGGGFKRCARDERAPRTAPGLGCAGRGAGGRPHQAQASGRELPGGDLLDEGGRA